MLCQTKGDTEGSCLEKLCVLTPEDLMREFITVQGWGSLTGLWFVQDLYSLNLISSPDGSDGKASAYNAGDLSSIPGS